MESGSTPEGVTPRLAATLVLLRSSGQGPEVLLTVRQRDLRFMPGAAVFPGGALDPGDLDPRWADLCNIDPARAAAAISTDDEAKGLGHYVAAIRETYEEVGLLLADGDGVDRAAAREGREFLAACSRAGVLLDADCLVPVGRWVTPLGAPVRFDAQFFVAEAPPGFTPDPDRSEVAEWQWVTPAGALERLGAGEYLMAPPTIEMLHRLDGHPTVDAIVDSFAVPTSGTQVISTRLSPNVHVVIAPNAGLMTGPGTNTYIVGSNPTVVIDPAVDDMSYLRAVLEAAGEVAAIVVTHRHPDHIGGVRALHDSTRAPVRAWGETSIDDVPVESLGDGEVIEVPGIALRAIFSPGHSPDHLCLYADGIASLFSGDNILGEGTAVIAPPEGNMREYLSSLRRLLTLHVDRIYPGHFRALDGGRAVIERYILHRADREASILAALAAGASSIEQIVGAVYVDTPQELHAIARYSVLAHLEMLREDERVSSIGDFWSRIDV